MGLACVGHTQLPTTGCPGQPEQSDQWVHQDMPRRRGTA
jgi:hypothetical protein